MFYKMECSRDVSLSLVIEDFVISDMSVLLTTRLAYCVGRTNNCMPSRCWKQTQANPLVKRSYQCILQAAQRGGALVPIKEGRCEPGCEGAA